MRGMGHASTRMAVKRHERMIWGGDLSEAVVDPALKKHEELLTRKARQ